MYDYKNNNSAFLSVGSGFLVYKIFKLEKKTTSKYGIAAFLEIKKLLSEDKFINRSATALAKFYIVYSLIFFLYLIYLVIFLMDNL
jgi:hypothetical protein